jgi:hypothetical protein
MDTVNVSEEKAIRIRGMVLSYMHHDMSGQKNDKIR